MSHNTSVWTRKRKSKRTGFISYYIIWRRPDGRVTSKTFKNEVAAVDFKQKKKKELILRQQGIILPDPTNFKERMDAYLKDARTYKAQRTVDHFDQPALNSFCKIGGSLKPEEITQDVVTEWKLALLQDDYSPATVRIWMRCLRTALNYMGVKDNPVKSARMPAVEAVGRVVTHKEFKALVESMPTIAGRALAFVYNSGVRIGELISLDWGTIRKTPDGLVALVRGKTGEREILLHRNAVKALGRPKNDGKVFPLTFDQLQWYLRQARGKAKIVGRVRWHDFRHTFATRYMEQTGDLFGLMSYCGWKSTSTMKIYQHKTRSRSQAIHSLKMG